jgi:hypothetical protein
MMSHKETPMAVSEELSAQREDVRFHVVRNIIYHSARRRALETVNRVMTFIVILLGTATASGAMKIFGAGPEVNALVLGGLVTVLASLQLVYGFAVRAKDHEILQRDYYRLLAELDRKTQPDEETIANWRGRLAEIGSAEPPVMRALDAVSHNEAAQAMYGNDVPLLKVGPLQALLKNVFSFSGAVYPEEFAKKTEPK